MRTILFILRKEFLQIFRHRVMLPLIFIMPIIQLLILAHAADYEVRNINLYLINRDGSQAAHRLIGKFEASPHFNIVGNAFNSDEAYRAIQNGQADLFIEIPVDFQRNLLRDGYAQLQSSVDAINGVKAGLASAYTNAIITDFNEEFRKEWISAVNVSDSPKAHLATNGQPPQSTNTHTLLSQPSPNEADKRSWEITASPYHHITISPSPITIRSANWFNPELNYQTFMVPGILVLLVTLVGTFLSGMNIVKEKEIGTIEQINVTPIRKYQFIIGKLLPFWIIALIELAFGLLVGKLVFDIPFVGSLWLIFGFSALYLLVVLGIGLLVSTVTETQQQAMFISWFFLIIFILMSGLFTPIESMPAWAQAITRFNPVAYFVEVMRMVLLKGSGILDIRIHLIVMSAYAIAVNSLAVLNYRKTT
ncbi:MAG: ABC transporter permease [Chitinophagales bacterium]|nr:ABC transporter permease [Chitinophagales bacterium]